MDDCVYRQAVIDMFQRNAYDDWNQGVSTTWANAFSQCADMVEDIPSADAVKVVRCKDCKWYETFYTLNGNEFRCCCRETKESLRNSDDFCSYGERKDD